MKTVEGGGLSRFVYLRLAADGAAEAARRDGELGLRPRDGGHDCGDVVNRCGAHDAGRGEVLAQLTPVGCERGRVVERERALQRQRLQADAIGGGDHLAVAAVTVCEEGVDASH